MASYAISDIHGALDEFYRLLDRIRFRYDGSDSLYLLGDFGDWGEKSLETIRTVMRLDERFDFVHCLMGNHELMFLSAIEGGIVGDEAGETAVSWLLDNRGLVTWNAYAALPRTEQERMHGWLRKLPLSFDVCINGHLIQLAHAYPYYYDLPYTEEEMQRRRVDAVWRRLLPHENPFASYTGERSYELLVCGHTVTDYYYQELARERNMTLLGSVAGSLAEVVPGGKNRIFHGDRFIDIDCGAKCMAFTDEEGGILQTMKRSLRERAQLAAYCLETGEEFYVGRPLGPVGELLSGESAPALTVPGTFSEGVWPVCPDRSPEAALFAQSGVPYPCLDAPQTESDRWLIPRLLHYPGWRDGK